MLAERRIRTNVKAGGLIEVLAPDLPAGETVDVTIRPISHAQGKRSVVDILAECPGGVLFKTAEEVDSYIREERDSWDR
ncbi:MAG: hypothetical protein FLDDKLPJ_01391 [Phycisphaerae bacterium]|nr:hypothetical protein [Phycisphaerae bacterium]